MRKLILTLVTISLILSVFYFFSKKDIPYNLMCPEGMKYIPSSEFEIVFVGEKYNGTTKVKIKLEAYCIDIYEYPNIKGKNQRVDVSWEEAKQLCDQKGKRLCSIGEWQKACRGPQTLIYPYGGLFDDTACNTHHYHDPLCNGVLYNSQSDNCEVFEPDVLKPMGSFEECISGYGIRDMSGGVSEWLSESWEEFSLAQETTEKLLAGGGYNINSGNGQAFKDGLWNTVSYSNDCFSIHSHQKDSKVSDDGFRCCKGI